MNNTLPFGITIQQPFSHSSKNFQHILTQKRKECTYNSNLSSVPVLDQNINSRENEIPSESKSCLCDESFLEELNNLKNDSQMNTSGSNVGEEINSCGFRNNIFEESTSLNESKDINEIVKICLDSSFHQREINQINQEVQTIYERQVYKEKINLSMKGSLTKSKCNNITAKHSRIKKDRRNKLIEFKAQMYAKCLHVLSKELIKKDLEGKKLITLISCGNENVPSIKNIESSYYQNENIVEKVDIIERNMLPSDKQRFINDDKSRISTLEINENLISERALDSQEILDSKYAKYHLPIALNENIEFFSKNHGSSYSFPKSNNETAVFASSTTSSTSNNLKIVTNSSENIIGGLMNELKQCFEQNGMKSFPLINGNLYNSPDERYGSIPLDMIEKDNSEISRIDEYSECA